MVLELRRVHLDLGVVGRVLVEIWQQDRLAVGGLDVFARAAVAVPTGADFVVEGAVDFIGFSAKDGGEVVGHFGGCCVWRDAKVVGLEVQEAEDVLGSSPLLMVEV